MGFLTPRFRTTAGGLALLFAALAVIPAPLPARSPVDEPKSLLGSYLAGRIARGQHDTAAASGYYRRALERDPGNDALLEQALMMLAAEGQFEPAIKLAKQLHEQNADHRMANLMLALSEAKSGRYHLADGHFKKTASNVIGELTAALSRAWGLAAQGDTKGAVELLDGIKQADWAQFYLRYHKALISDVAGRRPEARAMYERLFKGEQKSLRVALAYAQHASAAGDQKLARTVMEEHAKRTAANLHPMAKALSDRLKGNDKLPLLIEQPLDGLAEVFYGLGEALTGEPAMASIGSIYLQMALYLKPDQTFALASLANFYETAKQYDNAIAAYDRIPSGGPLQLAVDIRKALNLNQLERVDDAKSVLEKLAADNPSDIKPLDALGTIMRGRKRFDEAIDYYNRAITLLGPKSEKAHWTYYYARGTSYERTKRWSQAEADLQKALQLAPDQPLVLNYLGYSWVDQNKNLKQGLQLIEQAVKLKPDDGYIVDSLGWAHYRLGNYKEAVKYLERAVELRPEDPVLNDHLGDGFWRVGREAEARYQWEQALTLKPEPEDAEKIKKKLTKGLVAKPQSRSLKKAREETRVETPKRRTDNRTQQRPALE